MITVVGEEIFIILVLGLMLSLSNTAILWWCNVLLQHTLGTNVTLERHTIIHLKM